VPNKFKITIFFAGCLIFLILAFVLGRPDQKLHLIICDVGQGDGIVIITPSGNQILVDGGPDGSLSACLGKKAGFFDKKVELLVLTHPQADHMDGFAGVFDSYKVENVLQTSADSKSENFLRFKNSLKEEKPKVIEAKIGLKISLGGGAVLQILWPDTNIVKSARDLNDTSIVARLVFGQFCAYLTGDITKEMELAILSKLKKCPVLKVAHHGSNTGTSEIFLSAIESELALISAGEKNRFGHPHKEILERLEAKKIKVLRTDRNGTIEVVSDGNSYQVGTEK